MGGCDLTETKKGSPFSPYLMASQRLLSCGILWTHVLVLGTSASTPHQGSQLHSSVHFHMMRWSALCLSITNTETKESCCEDFFFYRCSWGCGHYLDFSVTRSPGTLGKDLSAASKTQPSQDRILWGSIHGASRLHAVWLVSMNGELRMSTLNTLWIEWAAGVYTPHCVSELSHLHAVWQVSIDSVSCRCVHSTLCVCEWSEVPVCCICSMKTPWLKRVCVSCSRLMFTTRGWDTSARAHQWSKLLISDVLHTLGWCSRAHSFPHHRVVCIWKCIAQKSPSSLYLIIVHLPPPPHSPHPHPTPRYSSSHLVPFIMMTQDFVTLGPSHSFSIEWNDPFVL